MISSAERLKKISNVKDSHTRPTHLVGEGILPSVRTENALKKRLRMAGRQPREQTGKDQPRDACALTKS
jgi:hypothetical protein